VSSSKACARTRVACLVETALSVRGEPDENMESLHKPVQFHHRQILDHRERVNEALAESDPIFVQLRRPGPSTSGSTFPRIFARASGRIAAIESCAAG
jgi:hypothetical protein